MLGQADDEGAVAARHGGLGGDSDAHHGGAGDGDTVGIEVKAVEAVEIALDGVAQGLQASGVGVESLAVVEGCLGRFADKGWRDGVAFAEPQGDDARVAQARKRHLGDAVLLEGLDYMPHHGISFCWCWEGRLEVGRSIAGARVGLSQNMPPRVRRQSFVNSLSSKP